MKGLFLPLRHTLEQGFPTFAPFLYCQLCHGPADQLHKIHGNDHENSL